MILFLFPFVYVTVFLISIALFQEAFEHDDAITYYLMSIGSIDSSVYSLKGVIFPTLLAPFTNVGLYEVGKMAFAFVGLFTLIENPSRILYSRKEFHLILLASVMVSYIAMTGLKEILVMITLILVLKSYKFIRKGAHYFLLSGVFLLAIRPVAIFAIIAGFVVYKLVQMLWWRGILVIFLLSMGFRLDMAVFNIFINGYTEMLLLELQSRTNFVLKLTNLLAGYVTIFDTILILLNGIISPVFTVNLELQEKTSYSIFLTLPMLISIYITRHSILEVIFQNKNRLASYMLIGLFLLASLSLLTPFPEIPRLKMGLYGVLLYCLINHHKPFKNRYNI